MIFDLSHFLASPNPSRTILSIILVTESPELLAIAVRDSADHSFGVESIVFFGVARQHRAWRPTHFAKHLERIIVLRYLERI